MSQAVSDYIDVCIDEGIKKQYIINTLLQSVFVALLGHNVSANPLVPTKIRKASGDRATEAYYLAIERSKLFAKVSTNTNL